MRKVKIAFSYLRHVLEPLRSESENMDVLRKTVVSTAKSQLMDLDIGAPLVAMLLGYEAWKGTEIYVCYWNDAKGEPLTLEYLAGIEEGLDINSPPNLLRKVSLFDSPGHPLRENFD